MSWQALAHSLGLVGPVSAMVDSEMRTWMNQQECVRSRMELWQYQTRGMDACASFALIASYPLRKPPLEQMRLQAGSLAAERPKYPVREANSGNGRIQAVTSLWLPIKGIEGIGGAGEGLGVVVLRKKQAWETFLPSILAPFCAPAHPLQSMGAMCS